MPCLIPQGFGGIAWYHNECGGSPTLARDFYNPRARGRIIEVDADVLDGVAQCADQKIFPQRACKAYPPTCASFIVKIVQTLEVPLTMVKVDSECQFAP